MNEKEECCGTCKFHKIETAERGFTCDNPESEFYSDFIEWEICCEEWEERD